MLGLFPIASNTVAGSSGVYATLSGTATAGIVEADIVAGNKTIIIKLNGTYLIKN